MSFDEKGNLAIEERIRELLSKKIILLEEILSCSHELSLLTYGENSDDYESLLEKREICIFDIKKVDVIINECMKALPSNGYSTREIDLLNNQIKETLKRILVLDEKNKRSMTGQFHEVKGKLEMIKRGRKGTQSYSEIDSISIGGAYTDNKG